MSAPASAPQIPPEPPGAAPGRGDDHVRARRRLSLLLGARIVVATVLLGGSVILGGASVPSPTVTTLALSIYATSLASLFWLQQRRALPALALLQIGIDLAVASALVWLTGGAMSSFSFVFGVVTLLAALIAGPRVAAVTAGLSVISYLSIGIALASGWIRDPTQGAALGTSGELGSALLRNVVGLFLVGWLAGILSDRLERAGGELERAEQSAAGYARLNEDIVRSLGSGLITTALDGTIRSINKAGARMFGRVPEALEGERVDRLLPISLATHERERSEGLGQRADGTTFPVGFTRTPLLDAGGTLLGSLVLFQDLTEITQLRNKAERAERLAVLGRLAAGLAHEIRNPLGAISGSVELVREAATLSDEDRNLLGMVLREVGRLNDLVTTMLEVGRPAIPQPSQVDLVAVAEEVVHVARNGWTRDAGVDVILDAGEPVHGYADAGQLRQILWNLIKNAVQASRRGDDVRIRLRSIEGSLEISVVDRGAGIAEEDRAHLFDMFFTKRRHGVGLGLALVKQIVDAHGGKIEVESNAGGGATFRVTLPSRAPSTMPPAPASGAGSGGSALSPTAPSRGA
jgi:two-component system, NtrC family, sensor histidine kinase PilS